MDLWSPPREQEAKLHRLQKVQERLQLLGFWHSLRSAVELAVLCQHESRAGILLNPKGINLPGDCKLSARDDLPATVAARKNE